MWNIFEAPWLLLIVAVAAFIIVFIFTKIWPNKKLLWLYFLPIILTAFAIGIDYFVKTDNEKIFIVVSKGVKAVELEDVNGIDKIIAPTYSDSFHYNKPSLMAHCRRVLCEPLVKKNYKTIISTEISLPNAVVVLTVRTIFDERSLVGQNLKQLFTKSRLELKKSDGNWLINRVEVVEINRQPAKWEHLQSPLNW